MPKKVSRKQFVDKSFVISVGAKIREIRLSKNMSQEVFAAECDVDYSQINRMELGKVNFSISYLSKIAKALKIHPMELLRDTEV